MDVNCLWYGLLLMIVTLQTGYIQPDEFFQNPEVVAADIFNITHFRPWEFNPHFALRSVSIPFCVSGPPFIILRFLEKYFDFRASPHLMLVLPRMMMFFLIPVMEWLLLMLASARNLPISAVKMVFRTSYLTFVFLPRTFSNSLEVLFFAGLMLTVFYPNRNPKIANSLAVFVGLISAVGIFNRPTFLAFGLVPWLHFLYNSKIRSVLVGGISGLVTVVLLVAVDSWYYGRFVVTPLKFILYNIDTSNNAIHGLHPRWFHLVVSLPQLFGPLLWFIFQPKIFQYLKEQKILVFSFLVPLVMISMIPHQEPRFLVAVLIPLFLLAAEFTWKSRFRRVLWITFNLALGIFFGFFHQGGITQSLPFVKSVLDHNAGARVFYYRSYIAPFYTLRLPPEESKRVVVIGLEKMTLKDVKEALHSPVYTKNYLLTPGTVDLATTDIGSVTATLVQQFCPHWSYEAQVQYSQLLDRWSELCLNAWKLELKENRVS